MTTDAIIRTLVEHQQTVRHLLESVVEDVRQWRGLDRELTALSTRLKALESAMDTIARDARECRATLQAKINGLTDQCSEGRIAGVEARAKDREDLHREIKLIESRLNQLERDAAVTASRYGVVAATVAFIVVELFRWMVQRIHVGG